MKRLKIFFFLLLLTSVGFAQMSGSEAAYYVFELRGRVAVAESNILALQSTRHIYYAIQSTEAFYTEFYNANHKTYSDGTSNIQTTIQAAIDATTNNRGDVVYVIGEWSAATTLVNCNKWGITLAGFTDWNGITGGGNSNITCTGADLPVITVSHAKVHIENLVLYANGTGVSKGIECSGSAPSQLEVRNVEIVKNGGTDAQGYGIKFTTVPTRALVEHVKITGNVHGSLRWQHGIGAGSYSSVYRDIVISNTEGAGITMDSYGDLFENITCMPTCAVGLTITGTESTQSAIVNCHNMAATPGASTAIISQSYITGLSAYTGL